MSALDRLHSAAATRQKADADFRKAILAAHDEGHSVRTIAVAAGVSHGTIHTIVRNA
jgi:DNA-directed RNA polymerase specialized sigma24 family protein